MYFPDVRRQFRPRIINGYGRPVLQFIVIKCMPMQRFSINYVLVLVVSVVVRQSEI
jgi:hypothetical protein